MNIKFVNADGQTLSKIDYEFAIKTVDIMLSNGLKPSKGDYISNGINDVLEVKRVTFHQFSIYITI